MRVFVQAYVRGCSKCQESKARTHLNRPPIQPITSDKNTRPFAIIAMDFIVKLPPSQGYDSILTVTDHDCTKAVILLPCREEIDLLGFVKLYLERIFPFIGLSERVISDQDPRFTSKIFREICVLLKVKQNIASGYHPQTDRQSEKTNQHVETVMRIFGNYQQDSWSGLLPIIQYQLNSHISNATKQVPYETWMGFIPSAHQPACEGNFLALIERKAQLQAAWQQATTAITQAQSLWKKAVNFHPYQKGDKVWLEGTNLCTSHPNHKLCPKRFGPFEVTAALSEVTYHLKLPATWQIHNVFHMSLLLPYHETKVHSINYSEPVPDLIDGEPEWEVEAILDSR